MPEETTDADTAAPDDTVNEKAIENPESDAETTTLSKKGDGTVDEGTEKGDPDNLMLDVPDYLSDSSDFTDSSSVVWSDEEDGTAANSSTIEGDEVAAPAAADATQESNSTAESAQLNSSEATDKADTD